MPPSAVVVPSHPPLLFSHLEPTPEAGWEEVPPENSSFVTCWVRKPLKYRIKLSLDHRAQWCRCAAASLVHLSCMWHPWIYSQTLLLPCDVRRVPIPAFPSQALSGWTGVFPGLKLWLAYIVCKVPGAWWRSHTMLLVTGNVSFLLCAFLLWTLPFMVIYLYPLFVLSLSFFFFPHGFPFVCLVLLWCAGIYLSGVCCVCTSPGGMQDANIRHLFTHLQVSWLID